MQLLVAIGEAQSMLTDIVRVIDITVQKKNECGMEIFIWTITKD